MKCRHESWPLTPLILLSDQNTMRRIFDEMNLKGVLAAHVVATPSLESVLSSVVRD